MSTTIHKQLLVGLDNLFSTPEKWIRFRLHNEDQTAWCLLGGMYKVAEAYGLEYMDIPFQKAWRKMDEIAMKRAKTPEYAVGTREDHPRPYEATSYNNHPATSFEDIKSLIREALETVDA